MRFHAILADAYTGPHLVASVATSGVGDSGAFSLTLSTSADAIQSGDIAISLFYSSFATTTSTSFRPTGFTYINRAISYDSNDSQIECCYKVLADNENVVNFPNPMPGFAGADRCAYIAEVLVFRRVSASFVSAVYGVNNGATPLNPAQITVPDAKSVVIVAGALGIDDASGKIDLSSAANPSLFPNWSRTTRMVSSEFSPSNLDVFRGYDYSGAGIYDPPAAVLLRTDDTKYTSCALTLSIAPE